VEVCRYTEQDRICIPVPFYHCFGMVMGNLAATTHGACMVIPAPGFDPALTLAAVARSGAPRSTACRRCSSPSGRCPTSRPTTCRSVRTGIMAGSPCPASMMTKLIEAGIEEMTICYGMTETSPVSTQTRTDDSFERKVGTVGAVHPHLEIKVVDPLTRETLRAARRASSAPRATR
jgi:fatty-acyl-CoA synthase